MLPQLGVLISGRGSNLQAIIDAIREERLRADMAIVISNVSEAPGLARAVAAGLATRVLSHRDHQSRDAYDRALRDALLEHRVDLVCLAGFMRLLGPAFLDAFPNKVLNIHPSLLPAFPGLDAQHQAFAHGVKVTGATVHFVNAQLDAGPIVMQGAVPVRDDDSAETLAARILEEEHRLYPEAIQLVLDGGWRLEGRRMVWPTLRNEEGRRNEERRTKDEERN
jgi:phosphoribosylglycinamide formyltransferase-1